MYRADLPEETDTTFTSAPAPAWIKADTTSTVATDSGRIEQSSAAAALPSRVPVRPSLQQTADQIKIAAGSSVLQRCPKPLCPLLRRGTVGNNAEQLHLQALQANAGRGAFLLTRDRVSTTTAIVFPDEGTFVR